VTSGLMHLYEANPLQSLSQFNTVKVTRQLHATRNFESKRQVIVSGNSSGASKK
jgi:hypothetical protein